MVYIKNKYKFIEIIILLAVILAGSYMILKVHLAYPGKYQDPHRYPYYFDGKSDPVRYDYPIHADEWTHLAQIIYIMDSKSIGFKNPYKRNLAFHLDLEIGYHLLFALFFSLTGLDPVLAYMYLPALFFIISSISLFFFVKHFTGKSYPAIFSILFFLAIPSNTNLLGNWFATPLTFSLFMIFLFLIFLDKTIDAWKEKKKRQHYIVYSSIIFILSIFIYPLSSIIIILIASLYFFLIVLKKNPDKRSLLDSRYLRIILLSIIIILSFSFLLSILVKKNIFSYILFERSWTYFQYDYDVLFYGIFPIIFSAVGLFYVSIIRKEMKIKIFLLLPSLCFINIMIVKFFDAAFLVPYERTFYFLFVGLSSLAGIGLFYFLREIHDLSHKLISNALVKIKIRSLASILRHELISIVLAIMVVFSISYLMLQDYYDVDDDDLVLLHLLERQDYDAIRFVGENFGKENKILSDNLISIGIYPISKNHVVEMQGSNLGLGDKEPTNFFVVDCADKEYIINEYKIDIIISRYKISCDFLYEVYHDLVDDTYDADSRDYVYIPSRTKEKFSINIR